MPFLALLLIAVSVAVDQVFKMLAVNQLKPVGQIEIISGFLNFTYVENKGAAFGMLENQRWFFIAATAVVSVILLIVIFVYKHHTWLSYTASILIVGGGIGNLIDRVLYGYVVDYIHFSFFPPVFNFADCCVTVGTVMLIVYILFFAEHTKQVTGKHYHRKNKKEDLSENE